MLSTRLDTERCALPLQPVLSLKARVALVKDLFKGEAAGYGLTHVAERIPKSPFLPSDTRTDFRARCLWSWEGADQRLCRAHHRANLHGSDDG
jgi:hypothetical protein